MSPETLLVYLVGFMGAGKSSVGARLAELLGWRFIDLDGRIEARAGESIRDLFRREGEPYFRMLEREELRRVSFEREAVVALGGGTFCSPENQAIVRATGASVYLEAPAEVLYARCAGWEGRPLFTTLEAMHELLERRRPLYEQAHLKVPVLHLTVDEVAQRIVAALRSEGA
jgi:shikimate kinase